MRGRILMATLISCACLAGCVPASSASGQARSSAQITADIRAANLSDRNSLRQLDRDRATSNSLSAARTVLGGSPNPADAATWAAVYLYADAGSDPAPLRPYLTAATPIDVRAMAAAGAVAMGEAGGFPVLIELLGHDDYMRGAAPPLPVWRFAARALVRATGNASMGPSLEAPFVEVGPAQQRWQAWWTAHQASLHWDRGQQIWNAG